METQTLPEQDAPTEEPVAAATIPSAKLFEWSGEVHVGEHAAECAALAEGKDCQDPDHFHAWVCLPNAFQVRDIGDKARAAKARMIRAMRDDGDGDDSKASDSFVTLEAALEEMAADDWEGAIEEVAQKNTSVQIPTIYRELLEDDDFTYAEQDVEELRRQNALPEDQRDPEEYEQLKRSQEKFNGELERRIAERRDNEKRALESADREHVIEQLRRKRIDDRATDAYLNTYYTWAMYVGARHVRLHKQRLFPNLTDLKMAAPEVVKALRDKISELENGVGGGLGNS